MNITTIYVKNNKHVQGIMTYRTCYWCNDHTADILTTVMGYTGFKTVNSNTWLTFSSVL